MTEYRIYKQQEDLDQEYRRLNTSNLSAPVKKEIEKFAKIRLAKGATRLRVVKCMWCLRLMAQWLDKDFAKASQNDLVELVSSIDLKDYAEYTKYDFKIVLKCFYKWFKGKDEEFPKVIKWLKPKLRNHKHKLPEELLTVEEVERLAAATTNSRDKAFLLVLYESGCRIGELLYLKLKNVQFDNYGGVLLVDGKTGGRRVRIIASVQVLGKWIESHPGKGNPEAFLWPARLGHNHQVPCSYPSLLAMLDRARKVSGVQKRVYPHLFRHSRATALASKLTEAQMKEYFGWTQGSEMAATYVHLSGRDVDSTLLQLYSLKEKPVDKESKLDVKICGRCKERNSPAQEFCGKCGNPLDEAKLIVDSNKQASDLLNSLCQDPETKEFLSKKSLALGLNWFGVG